MSDDLKRDRLLAGTLPLAFTDCGTGTPFLLLHGGAGPASMRGLANALARGHRVVTPVHPGFDGEQRPDWLHTIGGLATAYLDLIERLDLSEVTIVGNSAGGWIAAEMALRGSPRVVGIVLLNAVGIDADPKGRPIVNPMTIAPAERAALAFHNPARFAVAPPTPEAMERLARNQQALFVYAGEPYMHDPVLRDRLGDLNLPALVAWGVSDRIVDLEYGRRFAASIPGARFAPITAAGHFPQIEKLDMVHRLVEAFIGEGHSGDTRRSGQ